MMCVVCEGDVITHRSDYDRSKLRLMGGNHEPTRDPQNQRGIRHFKPDALASWISTIRFF